MADDANTCAVCFTKLTPATRVQVFRRPTLRTPEAYEWMCARCALESELKRTHVRIVKRP